jgi:hypothetical protein
MMKEPLASNTALLLTSLQDKSDAIVSRDDWVSASCAPAVKLAL